MAERILRSESAQLLALPFAPVLMRGDYVSGLRNTFGVALGRSFLSYLVLGGGASRSSCRIANTAPVPDT